MRVGKCDALHWVRKLNKLGFKKFFFADLPEELQSTSLLMKASREKFITQTGIGRYYTTNKLSKYNSSTARQHEINPKIFEINHANQKIK